MVQKKKVSLIAILIISMVGIFMAMAFLEAIADEQALITEYRSIVDENISVASAILTCNVDNFTVNSSYHITQTYGNWTSVGISVISYQNGTALTATTDWTQNATGDYWYLTTNTTNNHNICLNSANRTLVDYTYWRNEGENVSPVSRTIVKLVVLFFALGIIAFVLWKGLESLKQSGMET